jgi:DNA (cytosine-5)-methyltransferase 1
VTGRLSSTSPNLQNISNNPIKQIFTSRFDGGYIVEVDFNQLEVVALAHVTGDHQLIADISGGADIHSALYKDMLEIIKELQPQFIVAENVKGLRSMLKGKVEDKIKEDIKKLGYNVNVTVLNAADYFVPQKRERIIFIANRINKINYHPAPILESDSYVTTKDAIADLVKMKDNPSFNHVRTKHNAEMQKRLANVEEGKSLYDNYSDSWKKCPWNDASCTIKENHGGVNIHPIEPRVITVREMARLQSFPDDFIFLGSKAKQMVQIGNAVPPLLAKAVAIAIRKNIEEE